MFRSLILCIIKVWSFITASSKIIASRIRTPGPIDTCAPIDTFGPSYKKIRLECEIILHHIGKKVNIFTTLSYSWLRTFVRIFFVRSQLYIECVFYMELSYRFDMEIISPNFFYLCDFSQIWICFHILTV